MLDFRFTDNTNSIGINTITHLLEGERLWMTKADYPGHEAWIEKITHEIEQNKKHVIVAWSSFQPVGVVVYQKHKSLPQTLEIKNLTVLPQAKGRYVASFLLRNAEIEGSTNHYSDITHVITDTKLANQAVIAFAQAQHYKVTQIKNIDTNFTHNGELDVVLSKSL